MDMNQLPIVHLIDFVRDNPALAIPVIILLLGLVVLYYVAMIRAVIEMLRLEANSVLLVFAFLALFPFPLVILAGITILIIWHFHRRDLLGKSA